MVGNNSSQTQSDSAIKSQSSIAILQDFDKSMKHLTVSQAYPTNSEQEVKRLVVDTYIQTGRLNRYHKLLLWFPGVLGDHISFYSAEMGYNDYIPSRYAHYLGIMASAAMRCEYLIACEEEQFLCSGGDPKWLKSGIFRLLNDLKDNNQKTKSQSITAEQNDDVNSDGIEEQKRNKSQNKKLSWEELQQQVYIKKLARLGEINDILAQQPWKIKSRHIKNVIVGDEDANEIESLWKIEELISAVLIMIEFHFLSSLSISQGIVHDRNFDNITSFYMYNKDGDKTDQGNFFNHSYSGGSPRSGRISPDSGCSDVQGSKDDEVVSLLKQEEQKPNSEQDQQGTKSSEKNMSDFELIQYAEEKNKINEKQIEYSGQITDYYHSHIFSKFLYNPKMAYSDFYSSSTVKEHQYHRVHNFNWESHGYNLLKEINQNAADRTKKKLEYIFSLTNSKFGETQNVKTNPFRKAICYYIQHIYGVIHDDYLYQNVNKYLRKQKQNNLKIFIKCAASNPLKIMHENYFNIFSCFQKLIPQEVGHISLLVVAAKYKCALVYFLLALQSYQNEYY